ncbi:hypothetical protein [Altericroceibacterium endophyticum]|uniref:Uncharacterized protein n=1 Tax=Altericroceibacterium endophyticum TaxID=1808508 RepID=A0A6I4T4Y2_9SPHN|nr:hypothetical protein [Altericroceibacterium endophyticum]MXO65927.1 hypothetical protein [Altericroceibacterium endophyticum]
MSFWRKISPKRAVQDFSSEWNRPNPYRWRVAAVSLAATFALLAVFIPESQRVEPAKPKVTYITSWRADRTDEEIIASNIANQIRQDKLQELREAKEERRKELYRELGRATFLDVDAMEAEIKAEQAAKEDRDAADADPAPQASDAASEASETTESGDQ